MDPTARAKAEAILRASPWLRDRGEVLIEAFLEHGRILSLSPGQWAHGEGDDEAGVLVVVEGAVQMLCQAPGDREILIGQSGPGVAIGQTLRFGGGPRLVTVICTRPALVLGSTQPDAVVDHEAAAARGVDVVRRRSGGGAVLVEPGGVVWVDVVIPPDDALWDEDVGRAAHWVGDAWAAALASAGVDGAAVHRGGLVTTAWSRLVCFAGVGAGE